MFTLSTRRNRKEKQRAIIKHNFIILNVENGGEQNIRVEDLKKSIFTEIKVIRKMDWFFRIKALRNNCLNNSKKGEKRMTLKIVN